MDSLDCDFARLRSGFSEQDLIWLGGEAATTQARKLCSEGKVTLDSAGPNYADASIADSPPCTVRIRLGAKDDIRYECSCVAGRAELFCAHCIACLLAWLSQDFDALDEHSRAVPPLSGEHQQTLDTLRDWLAKIDREELIEKLTCWAESDEATAQKLLSLRY